MNNDNKIRILVQTAVFTALVCVATMIIQIPVPATGGYVNLGDGFIITGAFILGMPYAALAGGIGSALADLLTGYAIYAPATLVIKGLMAVAAFYCYKGVIKLKHDAAITGRVAGAVAAEIVMCAGYFCFSIILLGGNVQGALLTIPGNLVQGAFGIISGVLMSVTVLKTGILKKLTK
ncbi:MAG: ECF transporter S component [Ruminiclostridium sp.]|nr:ECF transporter S component [Ruminiclostridium sp.]